MFIVEEVNQEGPQPHGTVPVTLDIVGMYNNVPVEEGLKAFEETMNKREDRSPTSSRPHPIRLIFARTYRIA